MGRGQSSSTEQPMVTTRPALANHFRGEHFRRVGGEFDALFLHSLDNDGVELWGWMGACAGGFQTQLLREELGHWLRPAFSTQTNRICLRLAILQPTLKNRHARFEPFLWRVEKFGLIGRTRRFSLRKHSGTALVGRQLRRAGVRVTLSELREITERLKVLRARRSKKGLRELVDVKRDLDEERAGVSEGEFRRLTDWARRKSKGDNA